MWIFGFDSAITLLGELGQIPTPLIFRDPFFFFLFFFCVMRYWTRMVSVHIYLVLFK